MEENMKLKKMKKLNLKKITVTNLENVKAGADLTFVHCLPTDDPKTAKICCPKE
jgi:hypothetical protein